jgi:hypothetical protein
MSEWAWESIYLERNNTNTAGVVGQRRDRVEGDSLSRQITNTFVVGGNDMPPYYTPVLHLDEEDVGIIIEQ